MAIDTREKPINIKDLVVESPKKVETQSFDPFRLLKDADIQKMIKASMSACNLKDVEIRDFSAWPANLAIALPEAKNVIPITSEYAQLLVDNIRRAGGAEPLSPFIVEHNAKMLKVFFPERFKDLNINNEQADEMIDDYLATSSEEERLLYVPSFVDSAITMRWLFPNNNFKGYGDPGILSKVRGRGRGSRKILDFAYTRIFDPEHFEKPTDSFFKELPRDQLEGDFFYLRLIACDEIRYNDDGPEFVFYPKTDLTSNTPKLPEVKKYGS